MIEDSESSGMRAWVTLPDNKHRAFEVLAENNRNRECVVKEGSHKHQLTSYSITKYEDCSSLAYFLFDCYICLFVYTNYHVFLSHFDFIFFTIYSLENRIFSGAINEYKE